MTFAVFADLLPGWPDSEIAALRRAHVAVGPPEGWAVVTTPAEVRVASGSAAGLWLRGMEAGGPIAPFAATVLIRAAARSGLPWVVEGLGIRAMAASLAVGASGIAIGAHLWGLPSAPLAEGPRRALAGKPGARDTVVLGELADRRVRVLGRGPAALALREAEARGDALAFDTIARAGLDRWWARDALVPAPQCIAEAARWAGCGDAASAVEAIRGAVQQALIAARAHHPLRADPLGTGAPVVQGPMANVAERPALARAVLRAGGLPFFALGALDPERAAAVLRDASPVGRFGVGVIGFDVAPFRDAHLDLVAELAPGAPVTLAGATPELALQVAARGLEPWLHTPSGRLAGLALRQGVPAVILEGHEAGGHVGAVTSAGLWEEGLEAVEAFVAEGGAPPLVVLAGGIGDAVSAGFAAAMASGAAAAGARVALQAGTAFFFTHEIVEAGQLTPTCQAVALGSDRTVLVGSTAGLPLRCAPNAWAAEARVAERRLEAEGRPLDERRAALERDNVGRTRIAAQGIERDPARAHDPLAPRYRELPPSRQADEGAFTMGQGAAVSRELVSVADVVRALSAGAAALLERAPSAGPGPWGEVAAVPGDPSAEVAPIARPVRLGRRPPADAPIAIVGLGCVLPRAHDVAAFWENLVRGVDAVGPVPEARWPADRYWDPSAGPRGPARSRSKLAGAVDGFAFDPLRFRIPPRVAATMDPSQRLALHATAEATSGLGDLDGARTAVIFGNAMGGEYAKDLTLRVRWREVLAPLREGPLAHLSGPEWHDLEAHVEADLLERLPPLNGNSMAGSIANVIAGRVAQWLDAYGGNFTVDAACASSLAALAVGVDWLRNGRADTVVTGGVDTDLSPETFVGFSLAGALSSGGSRPFARGADGFVMGEGCGVLVLERLDDAVRRGRPVWAVIRGVGQSSDGKGRGITAPKAEGQRLALRRALDEAGVDVGSLGMVEAHGTGTTIGDRTEAAALREAFAGADGVWLGSVKSMLGHLKGAAGAAGMVKAVLSVATGVVPPTLHAGPVDPDLGLADGPFRLPRAPVAFPGSPRRAGVSAFGFGGTNFHVVIEQAPADGAVPVALPALRDLATPLVTAGPAAEWPLERPPAGALVLAWGAEDPAGLARRVESGAPMAPADVAALPHRLVVVTRPEDRDRAVARALRSLREGAAAPDVYRGEGLARPVALLVPGQGALRPGSVASLLRIAPQALEALEPALAEHTDLDPEALEAAAAADVHALHLLMLALAVGWGAVLADAGVPVAATVGHSLGEYGALVLAGRVTAADALRAVSIRGLALRACPPGGMIAVALPEAEIGPTARAHGLSIGAVNGPRSTILSGPTDALAAARAALAERGVPAVDVPVLRAFHSPAVASARGPLEDALASVPFTSGLPVISTRTARPLGADPRPDLVQALVEPVRFHEAVTAALAYGEPVEIGPGRALGRHVPGCVTLDPDPADPAGIVRAAAALLARGHAGLLARLPASGALSHTSGPAPGAAPARAPAGPEREAAREAVVAAIAEVTGYPPDRLADGADLEGELGIDSIRRMEILGVLQEKLGITVADGDQALLARADLDGLVDFVATARAAPPTATGAVAGWRAYAVARRPLPAPSGAAPRVTVWRPSPTGATVEERARSVVLDGLAFVRGLDREATDTLVVIAGAEPAGRAAAAFARCVGLEREIAVREIRVEGGDAEAEALAPGRPARVVVTTDGSYAEEPLPYAAPAASLPDRPVIVATGGASGVVARAIAGLAALRPRVLLLGRRPEAELTALAGIEARYLPCDVRDPGAVREAVAAAREAWGRIDVVIHGAGALADAPADRLGPDEVDLVLGPKLAGAAALIAATTDDHPALWVAFSSLSAWSGNPGQSAYAAANAALDAMLHPTAARSLSLGWTAWAEVGMAAHLGRALRLRGVVPLPAEVGAAAFAGLIGASGRVLVGPDPADAALRAVAPWPIDAFRPGDPAVALLRLDPDDPALADHRVGGRPLVPAALWVRGMAAVVGLIAGPGPVALDGFEVLAPTFVERPRRDVRIEATRAGGVLDLVVLAGSVAVARARGRRVDAPLALAAPEPLLHGRPAAPWYRDDVWFHGPAWRVLERVEGDGNGLARADLRATSADSLASAVDGAHQLLSAWSGHETGWLALPVAADRWLIAHPPEGAVRIEARASARGDSVEAAVVATDDRGRVVLIGEGVRLRRAARWPDGVPDPLGGA